MDQNRFLLAITELGGYPDFSSLYNREGFKVDTADSMRKALKNIKKNQYDVIVAEFNFQSDFRDRTRSLETLMAVIQRMDNVKVIIFYENEYEHQFDKLRARFSFHAEISYPIDENQLKIALDKAN